jgi:hypothetical protein
LCSFDSHHLLWTLRIVFRLFFETYFLTWKPLLWRVVRPISLKLVLHTILSLFLSLILKHILHYIISLSFGSCFEGTSFLYLFFAESILYIKCMWLQIVFWHRWALKNPSGDDFHHTWIAVFYDFFKRKIFKTKFVGKRKHSLAKKTVYIFFCFLSKKKFLAKPKIYETRREDMQRNKKTTANI